MFKFNWSDSQTSSQEPSHQDDEKSNCLSWSPCSEIFPSKYWNCKDLTNSLVINSVKLGSTTVQQVEPTSALSAMKEDDSLQSSISVADQNHSDLIPSFYEGGLKVWECTHDLANYLDPIELKGKSVLDLGCGAGLLGIIALKKGAEVVYFQDYNSEVLKFATIPNVCVNDATFPSRSRFFAGDWESFGEISDFTCDVLLTSETIYNPDNYSKLHNTIQKVLKPSGAVFLAAKSYYFGVGGSARQFEKLISDQNIFDVEVVWKCATGVQREILKLTFKSEKS